jgi:hypothetical protein
MLGVQPDDKVDTADTYSPWAFTQYAVVDNWVEEEDADGWAGRWSDHRAVLATLERV